MDSMRTTFRPDILCSDGCSFFKEGEGWCNNDCTNTIDYPERNISSTVGEILQIIYWQGSCHQANWCPTLWHSLYHRGIHGAPTTSRWLSTQIWRALRGIPGPNSVSGGEGDGLKVTVWVTWKEYAGVPLDKDLPERAHGILPGNVLFILLWSIMTPWPMLDGPPPRRQVKNLLHSSQAVLLYE